MSLSEDDRRRIEEEERFRAEVRLRLEVAGQKQREPQRHTAEQELPKPKQRMLGWLEEIKKPEDFRRVPLGRIVWDLFKVSLLTTVLVWFASLAPGPIGMVFFIVLLLIGLLWMAAWYFLPALVAYHRVTMTRSARLPLSLHSSGGRSSVGLWPSRGRSDARTWDCSRPTRRARTIRTSRA